MPDSSSTSALYYFQPPYDGLDSVPTEWTRSEYGGHALVWLMGRGRWKVAYGECRSRPPGLPLVVVLPPAVELDTAPQVLNVVDQCRPHSILPYHQSPNPDDLEALLRRTPSDLGMEVIEYIGWRGIRVDLETRRLARKTLDLSVELRTVNALARSVYMSRRALGRRFLTRGLPVPSHWLHFGRVLRAALRMQSSNQSLMSVAYEMGYSDGFSLSNQMERLTGVRPKEARTKFGWEWLVEAWLQREARFGGLSTRLHRRFTVLRSPVIGAISGVPTSPPLAEPPTRKRTSDSQKPRAKA